MKLPLNSVVAFAEDIDDGAMSGCILRPIPKAQTQEGPNCGFYALSIVMDYWKALGFTQVSAPARKRDINLQGRDKPEAQSPSLRRLGKQIGALAQEKVAEGAVGKVEGSTGGLWTAEQLGRIAKAVSFANFNVRIESRSEPEEYVKSICRALKRGVPVITAFDVKDSEPVPNAGQSSHWGVVIGYFEYDGAIYLVATHGHGGYYMWLATDLQRANFSLAGTVRLLPAEVKAQLVGERIPLGWEKDARTKWINRSELERLREDAAKKEGLQVVIKGTERPPISIRQDLAHQIVLVEPPSTVLDI